MNKLLEKMKSSKALPYLLMLTVICAGVFLLLPSGPASIAMTEEESRISRALSAIEGAGETRIVLHYREESGTLSGGRKVPDGAVIVSRGAGNMVVRLRLMEAAQALLGLDAGSIAVFPMEEEK